MSSISQEKRRCAISDFTTISLDINYRSSATPTYIAIGGADTELRWSDSSTISLTTNQAGWPAMIRPAATQVVPFLYAFNPSNTSPQGYGVYGGLGTPAAPATFATTQYRQARWNWDGVGSFASAPIMTAYDTSAHSSPTVRNSPSGGILSGNNADTSVGGAGPARSYLKANLWGQVSGAADVNAPGAGPSAVIATDGTNGSIGPAAGANWMTTWQGLMADVDLVTFPNSPTPAVAGTQHCMLALFTGPFQSPGILTPLISLKYTWT